MNSCQNVIYTFNWHGKYVVISFVNKSTDGTAQGWSLKFWYFCSFSWSTSLFFHRFYSYFINCFPHRSHRWSTRPAHRLGRQWFLLDFEVLARTDGQCVWNSVHYRPGLWSASWINIWHASTKFDTYGTEEFHDISHTRSNHHFYSGRQSNVLFLFRICLQLQRNFCQPGADQGCPLWPRTDYRWEQWGNSHAHVHHHRSATYWRFITGVVNTAIHYFLSTVASKYLILRNNMSKNSLFNICDPFWLSLDLLLTLTLYSFALCFNLAFGFSKI